MIQIINYEILNCVKTERVLLDKTVNDLKEMELLREELAKELNVLKADIAFSYKNDNVVKEL